MRLSRQFPADPVDDLVRWLTELPAGEIAVDRTVALEDHLVRAWAHIPGGDQGGMQPQKLRGRIEDPRWDPPILTFRIERHGAMDRGSTRAELQHWTVDVDRRVADLSQGSYRQRVPRAPRLDIRPIAEDVAHAILCLDQADSRLHWLAGDRVRVDGREALRQAQSNAPGEPSAPSPERTEDGRRRRLFRELERILGDQGWERDRRTRGFVVYRTPGTRRE